MPAPRRHSALSVFAALAFAGCVSQTVAPAARTDLMVARAGEVVQLEWQTTKGMLYTISSSETLGPGCRWQPLPQAVRIAGTGERVSLTDHVPEGKPRYYDVLIEPAAKR